MKASLLKRIASLEEQANQTARPPVTLLDVTALTPEDLDTYWTETDATAATPSKGYIHTIIIDAHESGRDFFQETDGLDDDELEAVESRRESERRRQQSLEREQVQLDAIAVTAVNLPPVPGNAYSIDDDEF